MAQPLNSNRERDAFRRTFGDPLCTCMIAPQDGNVYMIFYVRPFALPGVRLLASETIGNVVGDDAECSPTGQAILDRLPSLTEPGQPLRLVEIKYPRRARQRMAEAFAAAGHDRSALLFLAPNPEILDGVSWLLGVMQMPPFPQDEPSRAKH